MRIQIFVLAAVLCGCSTSLLTTTKTTTTDRTKKIVEKGHSAMAEELLDLPDASNVSGSANDEDCSEAYRIAEEGIIDSLPTSMSESEVDRVLMDDHRLLGVWYADTGWCLVYDIIDMELGPLSHSPHDQFMYNIELVETAGHLIIEPAYDKKMRLFIKVFGCPLCM